MFRYTFRIGRTVRHRRMKRPKQSAQARAIYSEQKELARKLVIERLEYFKAKYVRYDPALAEPMTWKRIAIRAQRSRWGSCSSKKNLNFNYRLLTLSPELRDYVIVHELCHLKELHHRKAFWDLMKQLIPNADALHHQARSMRID